MNYKWVMTNSVMVEQMNEIKIDDVNNSLFIKEFNQIYLIL